MVQLLPSRPTRASSSISGSTLTVILIVGGMVAALYFGREVLVPIALALLLSFVLAPLVRRLQSWRFPRVGRTQVQAEVRTHLIHRPARDIIPPLGGARV